MTIQHSAIPDAQLHEPKGIVSANPGDVYICAGGGTGVWYPVQKSQAACLGAVTTGATTGITNAYQEVNVANLGGTLTWTENNAVNITTNTTSGYMTVPETGTYSINYHANIVPATNGSVFHFTFGVDSGGGVVTKEALAVAIATTSGIVDSKLISFSCLPSLTAADKVYIMAKETTGGEEFTLSSSNFILVRVA